MDSAAIDEAVRRAADSSRFRLFMEQHRNAAFDQRRLPVLMEELRELQAQLTDVELRDRMDALIRFVQTSLAERGNTIVLVVG